LFYDKISAIIGAGIGGASTAHFLRKDFGSDADITIFEKGQVGLDPKDSNRRANYLLLTSHLKIAIHFVFYKLIGRKNLRSEGRGLGVKVQYVTKSLISSPLQSKYRT
jgi:glycine/D-amino acid oxidase-like deaminating enzyme